MPVDMLRILLRLRNSTQLKPSEKKTPIRFLFPSKVILGRQHGTFSLVKLDVKENGVAIISLNRPSSRNALNTELALQLDAIFDDLRENGCGSTRKPLVKAVVVTGKGKAFCAGADLKERHGMTDDEWDAQHKIFQKCFQSFQSLPMPTIAAANGHGFGGGLELICLADWAYAASGARFGFPEVGLGIFPGLGGTQTLSRLVGINTARRLILTGKTITADEGYNLGLFSRVECDGEKTLEAAISDADRIACNGPSAVRLAKQAIWEGYQTSQFKDAWDLSLKYYGEAFRSHERIEGVKAFNEKRPPIFK